ncbi:MAG: hypothetical protein OHK0039_01490 [Bacteroidia bacterium]
MTLDQARQHLLYEGISGSHAYGLDLPGSDVDLKGVFVLPRRQLYGLAYTPQVSDANNDEVYYELGRFVDLLAKNNPNLLEMLATPPDCIRYRHPLYDWLRPELFLSKLCRDTFAGYAIAQIRKARGLNKKILNPMEAERKNLLHFCYVTAGAGAQPLTDWLARQGLTQAQCGLAQVPHMKDLYALFTDREGGYGFKGVMAKENTQTVSLSSIPKGLVPSAYLSFNRDGYTIYCKQHREYWDWVDKRNELRYAQTLAHGKNYDAKNMMHTLRLLDMSEEILREGVIRVRRPNRDDLLAVRAGAYSYEALLDRAERQLERVEDAYRHSDLPETPDMEQIEAVLVGLREAWYAA